MKVVAISVLGSIAFSLAVLSDQPFVVLAVAISAYGVFLYRAPHAGLAVLTVVLLGNRFLLQTMGEVAELTAAGVSDDAFVTTTTLVLLAKFLMNRGQQFSMLLRDVRPFPLVSGSALLCAFALAGLVGGFLAEVPIRPLFEGAYLALKGPLLFFAVLTIPDCKTRRHLLRFGLILGAILLASGVHQFLMPSLWEHVPGTVAQSRVGLTAAAGLLSHPVLFGWFMSLAYSAAIGVALARRRPLYALYAFPFLVGAVLSLRAKEVVAVGVVSLLAAFIHLARQARQKAFKLRETVIVLLFALALCGSLLAIGLPQAVLRQRMEYFALGTKSARGVQYAASLQIARDRFPLGEGFGRFGSEPARRYYSPAYVRYGLDRIYGLKPGNPSGASDVQWPATLGETGLLGLAAFLGFLGSICYAIIRRTPASLWGAVGLLAMAASFVQSFAMPAYMYVQGPIHFMVLAFAVRDTRGSPRFQDRPPVRPQAPRPIRVSHFGPALDLPSGISSVLRNYALLPASEFAFSFVETYRPTTWLWGLRSFVRASIHLFFESSGRLGIVHVHLSQRGSFIREGLLLRIASLRSLPTCATIHGSGFLDFLEAHPRLVIRTLHTADSVIVLSEPIAAKLAPRLRASSVIVLPNAVPLPNKAVSPVTDAAPIALFAGELSKRKGLDVLLKAWQLVRSDVPSATLALAGPVRDVVLPDDASILLLGELEHDTLLSWLETARTIVLPSRAEGMPMIVLEAMAYARPVIATAVGATRSAIGDAGVLVDTGRPDELARALVDLLTDGHRAQLLGERGQRRVEQQFSIERIASRLSDVYTSLLADRSEPVVIRHKSLT